jgi:hypothetical protein
MSVKVNFEMGEKSSRIYIIKIILFLLYIYVSSKKGELKIEFDTHDTRDTHDTPPEKVECFFIFFFRHVKRKKHLRELNLLTYLTPKNADFGGSSFRAIFQKSSFLT